MIEGDIQSYERVNAPSPAATSSCTRPPAVGPALDPGSADEQRDNVIGTLNVCSRPATTACAASSSRRPRRSTARADAAEAGGRPAIPISPVRAAKLAGENYARSFHGRLRARDGGAALLQRVRAAPGPASQYAAVIPRFISRRWRRAADDLRRRGAVARLHFVENVVRRTCWRSTRPAAPARPTTSPAGSE